MSPISENDRRTWENYIANFNNFSFNFQNSKNNQINKQTKIFLKSSSSGGQLNSYKNRKVKPQCVIDLHGYRLHNARIEIENLRENSKKTQKNKK